MSCQQRASVQNLYSLKKDVPICYTTSCLAGRMWLVGFDSLPVAEILEGGIEI